MRLVHYNHWHLLVIEVEIGTHQFWLGVILTECIFFPHVGLQLILVSRVGNHMPKLLFKSTIWSTHVASTNEVIEEASFSHACVNSFADGL